MNEHILSLPDGCTDFDFEVGDMTNFEWSTAMFEPGNYEVTIVSVAVKTPGPKSKNQGGKNLQVEVEGTYEGRLCSQRKTIVIPNGDPKNENTRTMTKYFQQFIASIGGEQAKQLKAGMRLKSAQILGKTGFIKVTRSWWDGKLNSQLEFISKEQYERTPGKNLEWQDPPKPMESPAFGGVVMNNTTTVQSTQAASAVPTAPTNGAQAGTDLIAGW